MGNIQISTNSYQLTNGKYKPSVEIHFDEGVSVNIKPLSWEKEFNTKEEADKYATIQTHKYIKKNYN